MKIARIDVFPCRYPIRGYFKFFSLERGRAGRPAVMVRITADDGTAGWGQSVPIETWSYETLETSTVIIRDYYAPLLIGTDPMDIGNAHRIMDRAVSPSFTTGMPLSRAGIDIALYDLAGKLLGLPLRELLKTRKSRFLEEHPGKSGDNPASITLSWTINAETLDQAEEQIGEGQRLGYKNFNIKVAPDIQFDAELARLVRKREPDGFLWADANGGYDPETAPAALAKLADAGVDVMEAPLRPNRISGYRELKRLGALPVFMDEGIVSPVELEEFLKLEMMDGLVVKTARGGGLFSALGQIEVIERYGLRWLGSGLADPDISLAASLSLFSARGLQEPAALNGPQFLTESVLAAPLRIGEGRAFVPDGPGLGIEVDENKVRELSVGF